MSGPVRIVDGNGTNTSAKVTSAGELVTTSYGYDLTIFKELAVNDTGYNFYKPKAGQQFVITGISAAGTLAIAANALATVIVYEANDDVTATADKVLLEFAATRLQTFFIGPLKILVNAGKFVSAKTNDDDILMTIMGYYIPEIS